MRPLKISLLAVAVGLSACSKEPEAPPKPLYEMTSTEKNVFNILLDDEVNNFVGGNTFIHGALDITPVSVKQLADDYTKNEVKGDGLYKGHKLQVEGKIENISSGLNDEPFLTLKGGNMFMSPQAHFADAKEKIDKISALEKGQNVSLVCTGNGEIAGTAMLKGCEFSDDVAKAAAENMRQKSDEILQKGYKHELDKPIADLTIFSIAIARNTKPDTNCKDNNQHEKCLKELGKIMASLSKKELRPQADKVVAEFKAKGILPADFKLKD